MILLFCRVKSRTRFRTRWNMAVATSSEQNPANALPAGPATERIGAPKPVVRLASGTGIGTFELHAKELKPPCSAPSNILGGQ